MSRLSLKALQAAAGASAGEGVYVDDVFSTYLYTGNGSTQTITNGIDLDGEGGMVWIKNRSSALDHHVFDTERGATKRLYTNKTTAETTSSTSLTSFNSNGFSIGSLSQINNTGNDIASWTFRKQPGFFDIVTYTGNSTAGRTVAHNLGAVPGMIIIKWLDTAGDWSVYHRSLGNQKIMRLNSTSSALGPGAGFFNNTDPTSTEFTLGAGSDMNLNGYNYVAYLFAHDAQDFGTGSDESIIKCGSFTTDGSGNATVDLNFEPQWILIKKTNSTGSWGIMDSMRGFTYDGTNKFLLPDSSSAEIDNSLWDIRNDGFNLNSGGASNTFIYVAIRRPHKPAEEFAATDLFALDTGANTEPGLVSDFPVDFSFSKEIPYSNTWYVGSRLQGQKYMSFASTTTESTRSAITWDYMNGFMDSSFSGEQGWMFRRAPGFFDVVAYTGTGGTGTHTHNLGVVPELMIVKCRSTGSNWSVYAAPLGNTQLIEIDSSDSARTNSIWGNTTPTDSVATIGGAANLSGSTYIAYLFATVPGISKVGSYTGTGATQTIDCGFSSGARFVLLKGTTQNNRSWFVFDTERGITTTAPTSPFLTLNSTSAESASSIIEPDSTGFKIIATGAGTNGSGEDYIFLAIA